MSIIEQAIKLLKDGKLVAIPTETVYGLGADARNPDALQKIYVAKGRPSSNPLIIHLPSPDAIVDWAIDIPKEAELLANAFWPGPLTLILKKHPSVPSIATGGQDSIALRIPNHPLTLALLKGFGSGIAAPSANRSGRISPTTAEHVREELGDKVDLILDGGPCQVGIESSIVSLLNDTPIILREGSISASQMSTVLGKAVLSRSEIAKLQASETLVHVPGESSSHYAPSKPLYLVEKQQWMDTLQQIFEKKQNVDVISFSKSSFEHPQVVQWLEAPLNPEWFAQQLYGVLRRFDNSRSDCIVVEMPPQKESWFAIIDRLQRASSPLN